MRRVNPPLGMTGTVGLVALLASSGCIFGPATPAPNNPLNTGRVPSSRKFGPDQDAEKRNHLPVGSLAAEVEMVSVDVRMRLEDMRAESNGFKPREFVWEFR